MAQNAGEMAKRFIGALLLVLFAGMPAQAELLVFAAASLADITTAIADRFSGVSGEQVVLSFGSSSTLARQIEAGAPADVFISANQDWVDYVRDHAGYGEALPLFSNRLVVVAPTDSEARVSLENLSEALGGRRLALGDPDHVPAGIYAKQALQAAELWEALEVQLAPAEDARAALRLVERGAAPFGIVYATDALAGDVSVVGEIDPALHAQITYYLALPLEPKPEAQAFAAFVTGGAAAEIARFGFVPQEADQ
jgi:molybdate transport system substrate-binding protein